MEFVKIVDKGRRAFSIEADSTKAFEMSLRQPRNDYKNRCTRLSATLNAIWILLYKHHGLAPGKSCLKTIFFAFATVLSIYLILALGMLGHILNPISNFKTIGVPFMLIYPAISVLSPILGVVGCLIGSVNLLRMMSSMNSCWVMVNFPLTLVV